MNAVESGWKCPLCCYLSLMLFIYLRRGYTGCINPSHWKTSMLLNPLASVADPGVVIAISYYEIFIITIVLNILIITITITCIFIIDTLHLMTVFILPSWCEKSQTSCTLERQPDSLRKSTWPEGDAWTHKTNTTERSWCRKGISCRLRLRWPVTAFGGGWSCVLMHTGKREHNPLRRSWCRLRRWCSGWLYMGEGAPQRIWELYGSCSPAYMGAERGRSIMGSFLRFLLSTFSNVEKCLYEWIITGAAGATGSFSGSRAIIMSTWESHLSIWMSSNSRISCKR